jgi:hypothetical protein
LFWPKTKSPRPFDTPNLTFPPPQRTAGTGPQHTSRARPGRDRQGRTLEDFLVADQAKPSPSSDVKSPPATPTEVKLTPPQERVPKQVVTGGVDDVGAVGAVADLDGEVVEVGIVVGQDGGNALGLVLAGPGVRGYDLVPGLYRADDLSKSLAARDPAGAASPGFSRGSVAGRRA